MVTIEDDYFFLFGLIKYAAAHFEMQKITVKLKKNTTDCL